MIRSRTIALINIAFLTLTYQNCGQFEAGENSFQHSTEFTQAEFSEQVNMDEPVSTQSTPDTPTDQIVQNQVSESTLNQNTQNQNAQDQSAQMQPTCASSGQPLAPVCSQWDYSKFSQYSIWPISNFAGLFNRVYISGDVGSAYVPGPRTTVLSTQITPETCVQLCEQHPDDVGFQRGCSFVTMNNPAGSSIMAACVILTGGPDTPCTQMDDISFATFYEDRNVSGGFTRAQGISCSY